MVYLSLTLPSLKKITFTVTNDLTYDQRMHRICNTLVQADYQVLLIGRSLKSSIPLKKEAFQQIRLRNFFSSGKLMYVEYNFRLLIYLLKVSTDCFCAIDLDTIIPNYLASMFKRKKRVYDAHELFTEQKEIISRPIIHKAWLMAEKFMVPRFKNGYTVNHFIIEEFLRRYKVRYSLIRNFPKYYNLKPAVNLENPFIIYQGAVNEGRSFETLIPAMKYVNARLVIYGTGNFFNKTQQLISQHSLQQKVELKGLVTPGELQLITSTANAAIMLFEDTGLNQYQSLANRFFDYIMAGVPQVCVNYPQYKVINDKYPVALLINNTKSETIATALNNLLTNNVYYNTLKQNCMIAREELNWENEEKILVNFYKHLFEN